MSSAHKELKWMKVCVAIDSYKGSATSQELNSTVCQVLGKLGIPSCNVPIADGGEGTLAILAAAFSGQIREIDTIDLLGRPIKGKYWLTEINHVKTAIIESAQILGLTQIIPNQKTIQKAHSYGLGLVILAAFKEANQVFVSLGGSGVNDGGLGLLAALAKKDIPLENPLCLGEKYLAEIALPNLENKKLIGLTDVTNPYTGANGFSYIYGVQKGGNAEILAKMDQAAEGVRQKFQTKMDLNEFSGSGAAGGIGGGILLAGGLLQPGFATIAQLLDLDKKMATCDFVITGEGRFDEQTAQGKVPLGVARLARKHQLPVVAFCGARPENITGIEYHFDGVFSIQTRPLMLKQAMTKKVTLQNIALLAENVIKLYLSGNK